LLNLNRNLLGPREANEKGIAKSQALFKAAWTAWLLWVFCEMIVPTRGRHPSLARFEMFVSIWEDGSSQERASIWDMRVSRSMGKRIGGGGPGKRGRGRGVSEGKPGFQREFPKEETRLAFTLKYFGALKLK
jgi:hypothetical protein